MQAAAKALQVSADELEDFAEYYEALTEANAQRRGRSPEQRQLSTWKEQCQKTRPVAAVLTFIKANEAAISAAVPPGSRRGFDQRLVFMGVYGKTGRSAMALEDALAQCLAGAERVSRSENLRVVRGRFDERHAACREAAYPYKPACSASTGDTTLDCLAADGSFRGECSCGDEPHIPDFQCERNFLPLQAT